ncbi:ankyrin repeat-containing domain protein [Aspergillus heterothallicus]
MASLTSVTLPLELYLLVASYLSPQDQLALLRAIPRIASAFSSRHLTYRDHNGDTVLHLLVRKSRNAVLFRDLVSSRKPSALHVQDRLGVTPLMHTVITKNFPFMVILVEEDPSGLNITDRYGSTALLYAVENNWIAGVQVLLQQPSIDTNGQRRGLRRKVPLLSAMDRGNRTIAQALILHPNTKINCVIDVNTTPLAKAIMMCDEELANFIILNRPDLNPNGGGTRRELALNIALLYGLDSTCKLLLEHKKLKAGRPGFLGRTPLINAVVTKNFRIMELLLARKDVHVDIVDSEGRSALSYAVENSSSYVRLLLKHGAQPDLKDKDGQTPMFRAIIASFDRIEIVELLKGAINDMNTSEQG